MERNGLKIGNVYRAKVFFQPPFGARIQMGERLKYKGNYNFTRIDEPEHYYGDPRNVTLNDEQMTHKIWETPVCEKCGKACEDVRVIYVEELDNNGELIKDYCVWGCEGLALDLKDKGFYVFLNH